ncbi:MAG: FCD domain-containing protein [Chloroflexi bacterium]|nr:FCD domain-containing protein [Chloroflexota bacterium]
MAPHRALLYETVLDYVKSRITDGTYPPSQRLPSVVALAEEVGVGTSTVREGLRVLESLGLIRIQHGRGVFVSEDTRLRENPAQALALTEDASLLHIMEVRRIFEPEAAALAAERATPEQVRAIMEAAEEQERQIRQPGGDPVPADFGFHNLLVEAAHNPVLSRMVSSVGELLLDGRRRTTRIPITYAKSIHYHYLVGHAVEVKDVRQARSLMLEHITDLTNDVLNHLKDRRAQLPTSPADENTPA